MICGHHKLYMAPSKISLGSSRMMECVLKGACLQINDDLYLFLFKVASLFSPNLPFLHWLLACEEN